MKQVLLFLVMICAVSFADTTVPAPGTSGGLAPAASTVLSTNVAPQAPAVSATVPVSTPAAPPTWAQDIITEASRLPVVGPFVSKILLWLGIIAAILTTLTAAVLSCVNTLIGSANLTGLTDFANTLASFKDGKVMYWLKYFSLFNAQKPADTSTATNVKTA